MQEIWKEVPGLDTYFEASNLGRIRSKAREQFFISPRGNHYRQVPSKVRKFPKGAYGRMPFRGKMYYAHRLVAVTWVPNPNGYLEINHKDGDKSNNHPSNLEWITRQENLKHAREAGLTPAITSYKLTAEARDEIRDAYTGKRGEVVELAKRFNVAHATISRLLRKRAWANE